MKSQVKSGKTFDHGSIVVLKASVKLVSVTGERYDIAKEDVPAYCHLPKEGKKLDQASFSLNTAGTVIYSVHPWLGKFFAEFVSFQAKEGELPRWRIQPGGPRTSKDGRSWMAEDKAVFTVICKITSGDFEGCEFAKVLDYLFQPDENGFASLVGRSKVVRETEDFLRLIGLDYDNLAVRYTDNILPALEAEISKLKSAPAFEADFENGWPTLSELPVGMTSPKRPAKAPAKPAAKDAAKSNSKTSAGKKSAEEPATKAPAKKKASAKPAESKEDDWTPAF